MQDSDDTTTPGQSPVGLNPPADFGRRRVARILKREAPRWEQHRFLEFDVGNALQDIMMAYRGSKLLPDWSLGDGSRNIELYVRWRRHAFWGGRLIAICYHLRKGKTANLNSRFLPRPREKPIK